MIINYKFIFAGRGHQTVMLYEFCSNNFVYFKNGDDLSLPIDGKQVDYRVFRIKKILNPKSGYNQEMNYEIYCSPL